MAAESITFLAIPVGYVGDWHPAPRRQFIVSLSGESEMEVSDGEVRRLPPGGIVLVEDTDCKGHITRTVGDSPAIAVAIPLSAQ